MNATPVDIEKAFKLQPHEALLLHQRLEAAEVGDHDDVDAALDYADELIHGHGVESLTSEHQWGSYYCDIILLYVNMGDPYVPTIWYDTCEGIFGVGAWGDWLGEREVEEATKEEKDAD